MNSSRLVLISALTAAAAGVSHAEIRACPEGDRQCLERNHEAACAARSASVESCLAWLDTVERQAKGGANKDASLKQGQAYEALANLSRNPQEAQAYRERAVGIYRELIRRDNSDAQAILALAVATDDRSERIDLLRKGIALAPGEIYAIQLLASELSQEGQASDILEAARLVEQAYIQQTGRNKWHLASVAYGMYLDAGAVEQAARLRQRVKVSLGVPELTQLPTNGDPDAVSKSLSSLCDHYALPVLGTRECLNSLGTVVDHVRSAGRDKRTQRLADVAANAMVEVADADLDLAKEQLDQQQFRVWLEGLLGQGFDSSSVQYAYARVSTGDKRLRAIERAAALAPNDGQAALRLGLEYAQRGMWKEAAVQLKRAKQRLPSSQQQAVDYHLQMVEKKISTQERTPR